jgi:hypothetical protein
MEETILEGESEQGLNEQQSSGTWSNEGFSGTDVTLRMKL